MSDNKMSFKNLTPREERHYCAHLFAWLLYSEGAIDKYFKWHFNMPLEIDYTNAQIFYEFTALREYLYSIRNNSSLYLNEIKRLNKIVFGDGKGDIQKKKPDLAFYFPQNKTLLITEVKFEKDFDKKQVNESAKYGIVLRELFPDEIKTVIITYLGLKYYIQKLKDIESKTYLTWEYFFKISFFFNNKHKQENKSKIDFQTLCYRE
ncbi:MAG: hypothetical protein PHT69_14590 [Bacteroidales bacterium]|nr:hypothetical protein [Bacteroidales bacterium]